MASNTSSAPPAANSPPTTPVASSVPVTSRPPSRMFRLAAWFVAVGIAIVAAYYGFDWWNYRSSHSITEDAFVEAHIVNVAPEMVSGRIVRFHVEENDHVERGQILAVIEPIHYRDQVEQARGKFELAEAELKRQRAALVKLKKDVPLQIDVARQTLAGAQTEVARANDNLKLTSDDVIKSIDEAKAAVELADANRTLAKQEFDRFMTLAAQDATTKRKAEEVTRAHDAAKAEVRLADARLARTEAAKTRIEVARRDLEAARTLVTKASRALDLAETGYDEIREVELTVDVKKEMVSDARIALDAAQHEYEFTKVRAPFPGVVVKRYRNLGDFASAGIPILSMYQPDLTYVTANLEETRLRGVAPGNPVELQVDAFAEPFRGRVVWIDKSTGAQFALMPRNVVSGEFTKVVQRVPVRIAIEKDERWPLLRAGLSVQAIIAHGPGDPEWAEQAAREMKNLEAHDNQPEQPRGGAGPGNLP